MRKAQKEQICNFLELLKRAHEEIQNNLGKTNVLLVSDILSDVLAGMRIIENAVKGNEGEEVIPLLGAYCETVYRMQEKIMYPINQIPADSNEKHPNIDKLFAELQMLGEQIANTIRNDIVIKREVVFLPYKASMWDSLESVWKAAVKDPDCDVYVIPIPYYEKNADGIWGDMYYEGDMYPEYVPITDYKTYDFEYHRPETIYIHNPYDEYNQVTSVHPNFYSRKLKEYTENLIYIPYFVLNEVDIENEEAIDKISHFCKVSAVLYADKVIVQSEQMKQIYVKVLTEWQGEDTKQEWEDKILGLGSPKIDKAANTKKEEVKIPEEWLKLIKKPDGRWKKIILYNTSITSLLKDSDVYLNKIENVLQIFSNEKEEIVLWWRPHPLMQSTLKALRSEMEEAYLQIVEKYRDENWGIYDDSPDLNRAICMADAYYGDPSSVVQLCKTAGIPVMIQDAKI